MIPIEVFGHCICFSRLYLCIRLRITIDILNIASNVLPTTRDRSETRTACDSRLSVRELIHHEVIMRKGKKGNNYIRASLQS